MWTCTTSCGCAQNRKTGCERLPGWHRVSWVAWGPSVPTCSVTSRIHFDQELACRHSEVRPVVRGSGRHVYLPLLMAAGSITFLSARQIWPGSTYMHDRKKKEEEPIARLKQREKLRSKGKSCTKTNSCNPKVSVTDEPSKEGLRWPVWTKLEARKALQSSSSGRESSSAMVQTIRWKRYASAFETGHSRQPHHGDIRQQVLRIDEDRQQANSQHHRRRLPCWTTTTFRMSKKNLP